MQAVSHRMISCGLQTLRTQSLVRNYAIKFNFTSPKYHKAGLTHDEINMAKNRPLSPHLTIYKPQLTSMLSITHRMTGLALSGYAYGLAVTALVAPKPLVECIDSLTLSSPTWFTIKFLIAFPVAYHFANGVRHLVWDTGRFLTVKQVYSTGYTIMGVSSLATVVLCFI